MIEKCVEDMLKAIKLEPRNPIGYNSLAQCYVEVSQYMEIVNSFFILALRL